MKKKSIGDNIRNIRENLGYSQEYMASQLGLSQQAYSRIEKRPEKTSLEKFLEISAILQVSLNSLINENDNFIQNNFNQNGGNVASQMHINSATEAYEKLINKMNDEISFLRSIIETYKV